VQAQKYKVANRFVVETPDSRSTLLAVCEQAAEDLKIELEVATADTKVSPEEAARGPGVHPIQQLLQISVITSEFPYSLVESKVSFALASVRCGLNKKVQWLYCLDQCIPISWMAVFTSDMVSNGSLDLQIHNLC